MAIFTPRVFPEIVGEMYARLIAVTPLTDINFGSVWTTMLEAAAQEDDEQYFQMLDIIRNFSLDSTTGEDLDNRAEEYGLTRLDASNASTTVTIGDTAITKIETGVYSGTAGPAAGTSTVNGDSATGFPTSGSIIVGRGTLNAETVAYSSISVFANFVTFNLTGAFASDHGTDETIVLSQGGNRIVSAGTSVFVPASDISSQIDFITDAVATILDGDSEVTGVPVTATDAGTASNVPVGSIKEFDSLPFPTATVTNTQRVTNGTDRETDQELRDRIKDTIQSLSRGTAQSIITGVLGVISSEENKRVVSASIIEPTIPADVVKLFIDDGTGFIPTFESVGFEEVVVSATGGERFLDSNNVPIVKAFVETQSQQPYNLVGGETLFVNVGGFVETIIFESSDFAAIGAATAQEVLARINSVASLFEARVSSGGVKVRIFSRANTQEEIQVTGGTSNSVLNFPTNIEYTTKLYLDRDGVTSLLSKDGRTASIESGNAEAYDLSGATHNMMIVLDGKVNNPLNLFTTPSDFVSAANATAEEVCALLNARVPGMTCIVSSNDTKFRIDSLLERSVSSKIRVLNTYDQIWNEEGGSPFVDRTTSAIDATTFTLFGADQDLLHVGHTDVPFNVIYFDLLSVASANIAAEYEYWDGSTWQMIGVVDGTSGFQQSGSITLGPIPDWEKTVVNGSASMYFIRIRRTNAAAITVPVGDKILLSSTKDIFSFSETEVVGADNDYTLNRFIGQIELATPLLAGDRITLGSTETEAAVTTASPGTYNLSGGEGFDIDIDGANQTFSFVGGDFAVPGSATPAEVAIVLNRELLGITAETFDSGAKVRIKSNNLNSGTLQVNASASNTILQFPETLAVTLDAHTPAVESGSAEPYSFVLDDTVVVVIDGNLTNNFSVPCYREGTLTGVTSPSIFADTSLNPLFPIDEDIAGFEIEMKTGSAAGVRRVVDTYTAATGGITTTSPFPNTGGVPEETNITINNGGAFFDVIGAAKYFNLKSANDATSYYVWLNVTNGANTQTDPVAVGTGVQVDILLGETDAQIAVKVAAEIDALLDFSVPVPGGTTFSITNAADGATTDAADVTAGVTVNVTVQGVDEQKIDVGDDYQILPTSVEQVIALWTNGLITTISSSANILPSSAGTKVQISSLNTGGDASVQVTGGAGNAVLNFPTSIVVGVDGYRYFTDLLQEVQKTIDGVDGDDAYDGIRAAGVQVEVIEPIKIPVTVAIIVTPNSGVTLSALTNEIKTAVSNYVNTLPVGGDVIEADITVAVKAVTGVFDVEVASLLPKASTEINIPIADNELARINESNITVG